MFPSHSSETGQGFDLTSEICMLIFGVLAWSTLNPFSITPNTKNDKIRNFRQIQPLGGFKPNGSGFCFPAKPQLCLSQTGQGVCEGFLFKPNGSSFRVPLKPQHGMFKSYGSRFLRPCAYPYPTTRILEKYMAKSRSQNRVLEGAI